MPGKYLENSCQDQKNDNDNSGKDFYYGNSSKSAGKKLSQSQSGAEGKISSRLRSSSGTHSSIASNAPSTSTENDGENEANTSLSNERNMINEWAHCAHLLLHPCGRQLLDDIGDVTSLENTHRHSSAPRCNKSGRPSDEQQQKKVNDQFLHSNKVTLWALSQALKPQFSNPFRDKHFAWTYSCRSSISDSHCSQDIVRKRLLASPLGDVSPQASQLQNIDQLLGYVEDIRQSLEDCTNKINLLGHCVGAYNEPDSGTATATTAYDRSISARENQICAFSMMCGGSRVDKKMLYVNLLLNIQQNQRHQKDELKKPRRFLDRDRDIFGNIFDRSPQPPLTQDERAYLAKPKAVHKAEYIKRLHLKERKRVEDELNTNNKCQPIFPYQQKIAEAPCLPTSPLEPPFIPPDLQLSPPAADKAQDLYSDAAAQKVAVKEEKVVTVGAGERELTTTFAEGGVTASPMDAATCKALLRRTVSLGGSR